MNNLLVAAIVTPKLIIVLFLFITKSCLSQPAERIFYPQQLKQDAAVLQQALTQLHPGVYKFNSKKSVEEMFIKLNTKLNKPMREKDFYLLIAKLTEKIACGHTYLNPLNLEENVGALYMPANVFPFCFEVIEKRIIITHNLTANNAIKPGTEITKINGTASKQIIDSLLLVSRADGKNGYEKKLSNISILPHLVGYYNLTDIFLPLFFKSTANDFVLEFKTINNTVFTYKTEHISLEQRKDIFLKRYGNAASNDSLVSIRMLDDKTCYFQVGSFNYYGDRNFLFKKIDSLFASLIKNNQVQNLVVDIRKTEGGNTKARDYLLQYLLPKNFNARSYGEEVLHAFTEIPENLIPFLGTWNKIYLQPKPLGVFTKNKLGLYQNLTTTPDGSENITDFTIHQNRFKGKIVLMTSPVNSSVAFEVARIFQLYNAGIIVGEKTGGSKRGINGSRMFFLRLPYSRIEVDLPILYQAHVNDVDEGIVPDFFVKKTQQSIAEEIDVQLEYVQTFLKY